MLFRSILAESDLIYFNVIDGYYDNFFVYIPPPSLIIPSVLNGLENVFPFAYFFDFRDLLGTFTATSSASFPTLVLNFGGIMGTSTVFSQATISEFLGNDNITLFRNLMAFALWIFFAYHIYNRTRTLFNKK